jgi:lipid-binding SYLF domain-containing protein
MTRKILSVVFGVALIATASALAKTPAEKRAAIDEMAAATMQRLFEEAKGAKRLYDQSYGYAIFDNIKVAFIISGGGGKGVAIEKASGKRTYMNMGTGGVGLGLGGQKFQAVFLFQDHDKFHKFVEKGWKAEGGANAAAGTAGANAATGFTNGMAVYQFTEAGLVAQVDITGTKYWKADELNAAGGSGGKGKGKS